MPSLPYVLDSNVFIEAAKRYYAFDLAPSFWRFIHDRVGTGEMCSIDRVQVEIANGKDALSDWIAAEIPTAFMKCDDADVIQSYSQVIQWATGQAFTPAAVAEFARVADGWLVAYAHTNKATVVSDEVYDANIKRKVKIPNVCRGLNVPCVSTFEMLRALGIKL